MPVQGPESQEFLAFVFLQNQGLEENVASARVKINDNFQVFSAYNMFMLRIFPFNTAGFYSRPSFYPHFTCDTNSHCSREWCY